MKILCACEFSGVVASAFRAKGHLAWSCDLRPPAGDNEAYHIQGDAVEAIEHLGPWDMMIAHPPCTYLTNAGALWLYKDGKKTNGVDQVRWGQMREGAAFFKTLWEAKIPKVCVENPIMHGYAKKLIGGTQTQVIQPWMFGHKEKKATCLWLRGLPELIPTTNLKAETDALPIKEQQRMHYMSPGPDREKLRSTTYSGIAAGMADQWNF
jgi:hypothetical protein